MRELYVSTPELLHGKILINPCCPINTAANIMTIYYIYIYM